MTIRELAKEHNIKPASLQKTIRRWKKNPEKAEALTGAPTGLDDNLPQKAEELIRSQYSSNGQAKKPAPPPKSKPPKKNPKKTKAQDLQAGHTVSAIFAWTLISADATSCAWIAHNTYEGEFQTPATVIFAGVGFAIGYSAFQNISKYKGYNGDNYAWGFGLFQALIHLCAMQSFDYFADGISFGIGKVVIAIALPIATSGLAVTLKRKDA